MKTLKDRFEDWRDPTTYERTLALRTQRTVMALRLAFCVPGVDAEGAEGVLAAVLRTTSHRLPHYMVTY